MHAHLIIGQPTSNLQQTTQNLAKKLKAKILEFPLTKIEDVRNLNNLIRLSFEEPTLIVSENIHEATEEALNAFLKNLEEPQENIYFALTAPTTRKVLPTILSRCQVIKITNDKLQMTNEEAEKFLKMSIGEKLLFIDKIRDRQEALNFTEELINSLHANLHLESPDYKNVAKNLEIATLTLNNLKANGNVGLQLTNLTINLI